MLYQELPVYKTSYDLLIAAFALTKKFPREYKYTLWEKIHALCVDIVISIYQANSDKEKRKHILQHLRTRIETVRLLLRVCKDMWIIAITQFIGISEKVEWISKQIVGWEKSI
jgi:hypothetical protein